MLRLHTWSVLDTSLNRVTYGTLLQGTIHVGLYMKIDLTTLFFCYNNTQCMDITFNITFNHNIYFLQHNVIFFFQANIASVMSTRFRHQLRPSVTISHQLWTILFLNAFDTFGTLVLCFFLLVYH